MAVVVAEGEEEAATGAVIVIAALPPACMIARTTMSQGSVATEGSHKSDSTDAMMQGEEGLTLWNMSASSSRHASTYRWSSESR